MADDPTPQASPPDAPPAPPDAPSPPAASHVSSPATGHAQGDGTAQLEAIRAQLTEASAARDAAAADRDAAIAAASVAAQEMNARVTLAEARHLDAHRRALLAENAGQLVPELVSGSSPAELDASLGSARDAFARIAESVRAQVLAEAPARPVLPHVPAGASGSPTVNPDDLSPIQKMTIALGRNGGQS